MDSVRQRIVAEKTKDVPEKNGQVSHEKIVSSTFFNTSLLSVALRIAVPLLILVYLVIPLCIHFSSTLQRNLIFLSFVRWPIFIDLKSPEKLGLSSTCNFYLRSEENVELGVWHILPESLQSEHERPSQRACEESLKSGHPIILYAHGNSGTRGGSHRVELYKVLRKLDYHVIVFDYRGYADSSNVGPNEDGVTADATFMYRWLRKRAGDAPLVVWGHSLGTGVATKMTRQLCQRDEAPAGLILESPFNNLRDEVRHHPLTVFYRHLPFFDEVILDAIGENIIFASDKSISDVTVPVLILHAEDDKVVPLHLGEKLYKAALASRPDNSPRTYFHKFSAEHRYGHQYICRAPELPDIVKYFVNSVKS